MPLRIYQAYEEARRRVRIDAGNLTGFTPPESVSVGRGDETTTLHATYVSVGYFKDGRRPPALGRYGCVCSIQPCTLMLATTPGGAPLTSSARSPWTLRRLGRQEE